MIGLAVVGVMILMAGVGLVFALKTMNWRRHHDFRPVPGDLSGLNYLPQGTNVVAVVHVRDLLETPGAKELLTVPRPAPLDWLLASLEKWTRLKAEDLDHVVLGTEIKKELPQLTLVVRTRIALDDAALARLLAPVKAQEHRQRPLYRLALKPGDGGLWCPDPRTLVIVLRLDALKKEDLDALPARPHKGIEILPPAVQTLLHKRMNQASFAWVAGHLEGSENFLDLLALGGLPKKEGRLLSTIRTFGAELLRQEETPGLVLLGHFFTGEAKAARALGDHVRGWEMPGVASFKVESPPPELADPQEQWVTVQIRAEVEDLRKTLGRWPGK